MTNSSKIRIAIAGASGKMGREAVQTLSADDRFEVVAVLVRNPGQAQTATPPYRVYSDYEQLLTEEHPDVWVDFTDSTSVVTHIDACFAHGVRPVIGATGYTDADLSRWDAAAKEADLGAVAAPNFALGALLMIRFAREAARFFPDVEIIELHHDGKKDAPSGTANRTARAIAEEHAAAASSAPSVNERDSVSGLDQPQKEEPAVPARGLVTNGIHVHSVRLPGLVAHQEVIFGGSGETLSIRHDSLSRSSFMHGLTIACEQVMSIRGFVYGLENLLW